MLTATLLPPNRSKLGPQRLVTHPVRSLRGCRGDFLFVLPLSVALHTDNGCVWHGSRAEKATQAAAQGLDRDTGIAQAGGG